MRTAIDTLRAGRPLAVAAVFVVFGLTPRPAAAQAADTTYRVILYVAENGAPAEISLRRLTEVWSEGESVDRLGELLSSSRIQRLEEVTVKPGGRTPALRLGDVTVRVTGAYREPRRDAMYLRVEMEGGRETFVKEMISGFDETIVLAYPLTRADRSVVALIVPTGGSPE
ncbi:MAG: hypothetical protein R3199_07695 [Gemmatimonadota bacterium]|nr:hypothetical protein [Gemmatimonadota bacterium]